MSSSFQNEIPVGRTLAADRQARRLIRPFRVVAHFCLSKPARQNRFLATRFSSISCFPERGSGLRFFTSA
jgi:hypothetical protein